MNELIEKLKQNIRIRINENEYVVLTKTWYSITEDETASYIKCELTNNRVLVVVPDDNLIYLGEVIGDLYYKKTSDDTIEFEGKVFHKTGEGHQFIKNIEFGLETEVEGNCTFEDYECDNNIISLGILSDKNDAKADVYADIINIESIRFV